MTTQRTPWATIVGFTTALSLVAWFFGAFDPPKPKLSPVPVAPEKPVHVELSPEQKAEQAARKAKEDIENAKFARDVAVVRQLKSSMKNPASFDLEEATRMDDGTLCVSYRARNSFNAVIPGEAVITKDRIYTSDNRSSFVAQYNKLCANKSGRNMRHIRAVL
jgi:hypothetical protein